MKIQDHIKQTQKKTYFLETFSNNNLGPYIQVQNYEDMIKSVNSVLESFRSDQTDKTDFYAIMSRREPGIFLYTLLTMDDLVMTYKVPKEIIQRMARPLTNTTGHNVFRLFTETKDPDSFIGNLVLEYSKSVRMNKFMFP